MAERLFSAKLDVIVDSKVMDRDNEIAKSITSILHAQKSRFLISFSRP